MKLFKVFSFSLMTVLFLGLLTACGQPVSVLDELDENVETLEALDTIDVDMGGEEVVEEIKEAEETEKVEEGLSFDPNVVPEMSNGILVPTGFDATSLIFVSAMLGSVAVVFRRKG